MMLAFMPCSLLAPRAIKTYLVRSDPCRIELGFLAGTVAAQRALLADRIGPLENPVLPRGEAGKDFRFHRLRPDEAQIGFHAGETVGREGGAFLQEHANLVVPVDIVERKGDEAEFFRFFGIEISADPVARAIDIRRIGLEAR